MNHWHLALLALAGVIGLGGWTGAARADLVLGPDDAVVVELPASPTPTERFAAEELVRHYRAMTDRVLPIESEPLKSEGIVISIGRTARNLPLATAFDPALVGVGRDSFTVRVDGPVVQLVGGSDRGTLYAVYDLLEQWGFRWFSPLVEDQVTPRRTAPVTPAQDRRVSPAFVQREIGGGAVTGIGLYDLVDWSAKNRLNARFAARYGLLRRDHPNEPDKWTAWDTRGGILKYHWIAHNFGFLFRHEDRWYDAHPEYFALYNGQRIDLWQDGKGGYGGGNLVMSNLEVVRVVADMARQWFDENPDGVFMPMWPGDGTIKWDESPREMQLGGKNFTRGPEASMSRRLVTFTNAVARRVARTHPDRLILLPAYATYLEPVAGVRHEPNVLVQYCYHGDYAHGPLQSETNLPKAQQMKQWASQASHFGVWEYFLLGDLAVNEPVPVILPLVYRARDTVRFLHALGARFYFTQSNTAYQASNPLLQWALARYLWDPALEADELIADYCTHAFGSAAGAPMTRFYTLLEQAVQQSKWTPVMYAQVATPSPLVWTPAVVEQSQKLLAEAQAMAQGDADASARLARVAKALQFTIASIRTQQVAGLDSDKPWRVERQRDAYLINADAPPVPEADFQQAIQHAIDTGTFDASLQRVAFRGRARRATIAWLQGQGLTLGVLPEIGGRAIRLIDAAGHNYMAELPLGDTLPQIGAAFFAYGGYEEFVGKGFAAPGWEQPYTLESGGHDSADSLRVATVVGDLRLTRVYSLVQTGQAPAMQVVSTLTNTGAASRTSGMRSHPTLTIGDNNDDLRLHYFDGKAWTDVTLHDAQDRLMEHVAGLWAVVDTKSGRGLAHQFDPAEGSAYFYRSAERPLVQMEVFGKQETIASGERITLRQRFIPFQSQGGRLPEWLAAGQLPALPDAAAVIAAPQPPAAVKLAPMAAVASADAQVQMKQVEAVDGVVGKGGRFAEGSQLVIAKPLIQPTVGSVAFWARLPQSSALTRNMHFLGSGQNNPSWFSVSANEGKLAFLFKHGRQPYNNPGEFYNSISLPIAWEANTWHHVAVTWDAGDPAKPGNGKLRIFVDGKRIEHRDNAVLSDVFNAENVVLGRSSASAKVIYLGDLDEVLIAPAMLTDEQIADLHKVQQSGRTGNEVPGAKLITFDAAK